MKSQLYLWEPLRQKYIGNLTLIKTMFIERIQPILQMQRKRQMITEMSCGMRL